MTYSHVRHAKSLGHNELLLVKSVSKFSYETLASKPVFADNLCAEYLCLILLTLCQPQFDSEVITKLIKDLKTLLLDEVLPFNQNIRDKESLGMLKSYLKAPRDSFDKLDKLTAIFLDKVRAHSEMQSAAESDKETGRAKRK